LHKLLLPIRDRGLGSFLHENATDESHMQSPCALALGHSLILDETRRNISRSPSEYQGEQAPEITGWNQENVILMSELVNLTSKDKRADSQSIVKEKKDPNPIDITRGDNNVGP